MQGVLTGFAIVLAVIFIGWLLAVRGVIGSDRERLMFNKVAFYAATPALLFDSVANSDPGTILTPVTLIIILATAVIAAIYLALFWRTGLANATSGAAASSYFNSVNIGLPVSIYVLGESTYAIPMIFIQMVLFTPLILGALGGKSLLGAVKTGLLSPMVVASMLGFVVAYLGVNIPDPVAKPIALLGGASIPMILMSFGASLKTSAVLSDAAVRPQVATASALKLVGMPAVAFLLARLFGLSPDHVYAATILAALPTAQQVYNYAATFQKGQTVARDTVFITTFAALPVMLVIAALFGR
ncbi:AEC family transporter [Corynebacterium lizhenjunii]|uniref:AEC family transporter n=1 Tax=Corynebacterium lizhenjunii TaxID=2709394 RepID=A0A7T0KF16_9CORY|nr:AEC family transporter [Corynebacterium lizhenjunii]QPK79432.1 AEC family transporter [Corynebacterium lizhenjunii]